MAQASHHSHSSTGCGNASLANAKTINLCNNPLTKEPKLDQASRLGGGRWLALDSRVEDLMAIAAKDTSARARQQKTSFRRGRMAQCVVVVCSCQSGCRWLS